MHRFTNSTKRAECRHFLFCPRERTLRYIALIAQPVGWPGAAGARHRFVLHSRTYKYGEQKGGGPKSSGLNDRQASPASDVRGERNAPAAAALLSSPVLPHLLAESFRHLLHMVSFSRSSRFAAVPDSDDSTSDGAPPVASDSDSSERPPSYRAKASTSGRYASIRKPSSVASNSDSESDAGRRPRGAGSSSAVLLETVWQRRHARNENGADQHAYDFRGGCLKAAERHLRQRARRTNRRRIRTRGAV